MFNFAEKKLIVFKINFFTVIIIIFIKWHDKTKFSSCIFAINLMRNKFWFNISCLNILFRFIFWLWFCFRFFFGILWFKWNFTNSDVCKLFCIICFKDYNININLSLLNSFFYFFFFLLLDYELVIEMHISATRLKIPITFINI